MNNRMQVLRKLTLLTIAAAMMVVLLAACSQGGNAQNPNVEVTTDPTEAPAPEMTPAHPFTAPLTGLGRDTEADSRPIAVMINNLKPARPQSGLTNADIVWEVLAEGGITRLIAIFQSTDKLTESIGPIRSIRPYLIDIGESYGAVLAHAGGSNDAYAILQQQKKPYLDEISNAGSYFWRSKERKAPHNLYSDLEKLRNGADKRGYASDRSVPVYSFIPGSQDGAVPVSAAAGGGTDATTIEIGFTLKNYKVSYAYDAASGLYQRSINGEPHVDMNNNEQLKAANLVVLGARHKTLDDVGRLDVDLHAGGSAMLFQQGKAISCEWVRSSDNMIRIMKDGAELPFVPGVTYFHVVPNTPSFEDHIIFG
ncbi:DUF3048 domain-containing protein [Paenibacillus gorillae]|uniref:DUF3048 domain-containing protein n=1 Tax=Paenibacillus gorillae TaxID=1243662 RepID=UPI0004ACB96B|nr:DUF3048 domain-containing protein [Paenibacillus gorillae]